MPVLFEMEQEGADDGAPAAAVQLRAGRQLRLEEGVEPFGGRDGGVGFQDAGEIFEDALQQAEITVRLVDLSRDGAVSRGPCAVLRLRQDERFADSGITHDV